MRSSRLFHSALLVGCALLLSGTCRLQASPPQTAGKSSSQAGSKRTHKASSRHHRRRSSRHRGQQSIDSGRAREIQEALIREQYLKGTPSGKWDRASQEAMQRYQSDNGWQTKTVPDARALIKLGLGPDHEHLLNPETAMTGPPSPPQKPSPAAAAKTEATSPPAGDPANSSQAPGGPHPAGNDPAK